MQRTAGQRRSGVDLSRFHAAACHAAAGSVDSIERGSDRCRLALQHHARPQVELRLRLLALGEEEPNVIRLAVVEVQAVADVFDEKAATALGLERGRVTVMIHTGSRGLGHQVATDFIRTMFRAMPQYHVSLPDRELAGVPFNTPEGQAYFRAMTGAANFA